jgi:hypothetical protein
MKNIHILPTDKPSRLSILNSGKLDFGAEIMSSSNSKPQHIYITSDEEIKDVRPHKGKWQLEKGLILNKFPDYLTDLSECKLIILTTDQDLINDGVQAIDDEFLEWFVKNPSCEEVEFKCYSKFNDGDFTDYKIIIPKEEPKQYLEKEMFELEEQLDIPSHLRWHNSKPKQETHICKYCNAETSQSDDECYAKPKTL